FQAEDGIRDGHVTGVQTCALPILNMPTHPKEKPIAWVGMFMLLNGTSRSKLAHAYVDAWSSARSAKWLEDNYGYGHANTLARPRSEERRVGKECRRRWVTER